MQYGICNLGIIPLKSEPSDVSGMLNQLLYGECFTIVEQRENWSHIRTAFDSFEGWVDNKQYSTLSEEAYLRLVSEDRVLTNDLLEFVTDKEDNLIPIPLGSILNGLPEFQHHYDGEFTSGHKSKLHLLQTATLYLNAPFLWGGRTPFGIDNSGFVQMVYNLNGILLPRDVHKMALQGESMGFIEECEPGDLAFFDNEEGIITHVGIIMEGSYIIHAYGKVRIDRLDQSGIFNTVTGRHTHQLRLLKKII